MPSFGEASEKRLRTCHPDIQTVMRETSRLPAGPVLPRSRPKPTDRAGPSWTGSTRNLNTNLTPPLP